MVLVLVVGPSGAGKDTLISRAQDELADDPRFSFVRRVVTRNAVAALEDHETMDEAAFTVALMRGDFALHWDAHGLRYAIPVAIDAALEAGRVVVANGSRAAIPAAQAKYPDCVVFLVTADRELRALRLAARGRENAGAVRARLDREGIELAPNIERVTIDNSGHLAESVTRFIEELRRLTR
ncbi:MAG TPA: phosphonate metabolism protein/1,5-bisphosphokinase (PRPP-forming) PhnN [Devosia sp.]|nr:phosphonate metabolism protein/1,5-bisphosphokinase (PRPP-forming) PhnN [Devosia sp.]